MGFFKKDKDKDRDTEDIRKLTPLEQGTPCGRTVYADTPQSLGWAYSAHVSSCKKCSKK